MSKPKIVFMGTPEFAVPSLESLLRHDYPIVGVVTQPDRPKGRGQHLLPSPVKVFAQSHHLPVLQPERVRNSEFIELFRQLAPDLVVVAAFGQKLPGEILQTPKMGCINVHPSLLPKYRGAAPINWTLIRGETKTGVTIMMIDEGLDTGDILTQQETMIDPDETFGELHDRLADIGASLLLKTIEMILSGTVKQSPQDASGATYAPRLKKEDGLIRWDADIHQTVNLIRGLSPAPCAYTFFKGKMLKIFSAQGEEIPVTETPGTVGRETEKGLPLAAKDGYVYLKGIQLENKKRMSVHDFLRGFHISPGDTLG
ncbi:MAG: methionyl-tRNA formyltransferase [Deltaproteobacteria bacterium]|nr:methionyl-tRNA formyltransferase [Deltaproteobacteria bacterium]